MTEKTLKTSKLRLRYELDGPASGEPLLLLHGWPDSPRTWDKVLPSLHAVGYRTIAPYIRGYGDSEFRDRIFGRNPPRTGQPVAFAQDMIDLLDHLGIARIHFIGHDWGARTGYALAALFPERLKSLTTLAVPFKPGKAQPPAFPQCRAFWYQWLFCTIPGEKKWREDPVAYGRAMWDAWSPKGWYTEAEFKAAAKSWHGQDFEDVVLHSYRSRWGHAELDPAYDTLQKKLEGTATLNTPTLLIHGGADSCELRETTDGAEKFFTGPYRRVVLEGIGHFPQREYPGAVAGEILQHLQRNQG